MIQYACIILRISLPGALGLLYFREERSEAMSSIYNSDEIKTLMKRVLSEYCSCGQIGISCDRAGVRRKTHDHWMEKYPRYKELVEEVKERFWDNMEVVAHDRAKEKSDALLMFLLKSNRPEKYRDTVDANLNHQNVTPVQLIFAEGMLSEEEKAILTNQGGEKDAGDN